MAGGIDIALSLFALAQDNLRMAIQHLARLSRRHPALGADQQLLLQLGFQGCQLLTQRRLRHMQHISGLGHAADVDQFYEILQSTQVQNGGAHARDK